MRIGFVIYGSLDTLSGGYLYDRIVVRGLAELGHEVEVISLAGDLYLQRLSHGFSSRLTHRLLAGRFDILIQDELCHPSLFLVNSRLRRQQGPTLVALVHHILCNESRGRWYNAFLAVAERRYLNSVDGFIHNSKTTQRAVAALVSHDRPQVIAYPAGNRLDVGISFEEISNRIFSHGPLELLFLGNVIPRKGLLPLLRALAEIDRDSWRLSVVGGHDFDPAHVAEARQLVRQLGLSEMVRFMGPLREEQLVEVLNRSHLFCMPYAYEGFGIAILEAMAFGLPAIGCRDGAAGETINHGVNGFVMDSGDLVGLQQLLTRLHRDREQLLELTTAARETYARSPNWQDCIAAINGFLLELKGLREAGKPAFPSRYPAPHRRKNSDATG